MSNTDNTAPAHHFYASSVAEWGVTTPTRSLTDLIRYFDKSKFTYAIWYVPVPHSDNYMIRFYAPQVEGAHVVEIVEFSNGRKVKRNK